jgi:hypothetical protein
MALVIVSNRFLQRRKLLIILHPQGDSLSGFAFIPGIMNNNNVNRLFSVNNNAEQPVAGLIFVLIGCHNQC